MVVAAAITVFAIFVMAVVIIYAYLFTIEYHFQLFTMS